MEDFEILDLLPTGKQHVSYSEIAEWMDCSWRHKLKHVDKIDDGDRGSIHTEFGQVIHNGMELYFNNGRVPHTEEDIAALKKDFKKRIKALMDDPAIAAKMTLEDKSKLVDDMKEFSEAIVPMLSAAVLWLDETFPGWEPVSAEESLMEPITGLSGGVLFKGFVDAFIRYPKRRKVKKTNKKAAANKIRLNVIQEEVEEAGKPDEYEFVEPREWIYHILDWKTTSWGWMPEKKQSEKTKMQIILYKYFFCQKKGLKPEQIKCSFVLLKRTPAKSRPDDRCELVTVSAGEVALKKSLDAVHNMVQQVRQGRAVKNKMSCKFCKFAYTEHCT